MLKKYVQTLKNRKIFGVFLLGISSGLPLLLIGSTLKAWLKVSGIDLATIGTFSIVGLPFTLKFLFSPLFDRFELPFLGRRRGFIFVFQLFLAALTFLLSTVDPSTELKKVEFIAVAIAFIASFQDIVIDAYRREVLEEKELGLGVSMAVTGYRIAMFVTGTVALTVADSSGWQTAYQVCGAAFLVCTLFTFIAQPETLDNLKPKTFKAAVIEPFRTYFSRPRALEILLFILLYKVGDQMASEMLSPFYIERGYTLTEIGWASKSVGILATILGGIAGGVWILRIGISKALWIFGGLQALSTLTFCGLALLPTKLAWIGIAVGIENFTGGLGTAAYSAFMATLCDRRYTATQFALLSSVTGVPRTVFAYFSGTLASAFGWVGYFLFCTFLATPGLLLLLRRGKWKTQES